MSSLGQKRVCPSCTSKFFDLGKRPASCPRCGHVFDPMVVLRRRKVDRRAVTAADADDLLIVAAQKAKAIALRTKSVDVTDAEDDSGADEGTPDVGIEEMDDIEDIESLEELEDMEEDEDEDEDELLEEGIADEILVDNIEEELEALEEAAAGGEDSEDENEEGEKSPSARASAAKKPASRKPAPKKSLPKKSLPKPAVSKKPAPKALVKKPVPKLPAPKRPVGKESAKSRAAKPTPKKKR